MLAWLPHCLRPRPPKRTDDILRDFEDSQQPECPQHTDPKGGSWLDGRPDHFEDAPHDDLQRRRGQPGARARLLLSVSICPAHPVRSSSHRRQHEAQASH